MKNFRTYDLAMAFYCDCKGLKFKAPFKDQFDRALLSMLLNLVEGSAKPTSRDRRKFYAISLGSFREVQLILDLSGATHLLEKSDPVAASLYRLMQNPGGS